jgi:hypothetical protein
MAHGKNTEYMKTKAYKRVNILRSLKFKLDRKSLHTLYISYIRPPLEYGDIIWDNCTLQEEHDLENIQLEAARIITGATKLTSHEQLYLELGWDTL